MMKDAENVQVSLKAEIRNESVEIVLTDNGIGVDESVIHRLFDMFFKGTELSKGNGLGLYIVQKSVQALDGKIEVESELGSFTKFTVNLPLKSMEFGSNLTIGTGQPLDETMMNQ
jgi:signal transduction histidine kinase